MKERAFLGRVQELGGLATRQDADRWSMAVLGVLSDLLADAEGRRHFLSQLPGTLKARLLAAEPGAYEMDRDTLVQRIAAALGVHAREGERVLRAVYRVLGEAVSAGQLAEYKACLPKDLAAFLEERQG
jgi:uncharacterized protein (DUF2267 family)